TPELEQKSDNESDYMVSFPRLFRSSGADSYNYLVCLEDGKRSTVLSGETANTTLPPLLNVSTNPEAKGETEDGENKVNWEWQGPGKVSPPTNPIGKATQQDQQKILAGKSKQHGPYQQDSFFDEDRKESAAQQGNPFGVK